VGRAGYDSGDCPGRRQWSGADVRLHEPAISAGDGKQRQRGILVAFAQRLWRKGEESGHAQRVRSIRTDCDGDVLLLSIDQEGGIACHTGRESCFFYQLRGNFWVAVDPVLKDPKDIYGK
jgi:hypothetical protein